VVRELLAGKEVEYEYRGKTIRIQFLHRDRYFINLDTPIPMYVAANLPLALKAAGAYGDGWMTISTGPMWVSNMMPNFIAFPLAEAATSGRSLQKLRSRTVRPSTPSPDSEGAHKQRPGRGAMRGRGGARGIPAEE
jgi:hypothetical protein